MWQNTILKCQVVYLINDYEQVKNGGHRTCPTYSFWVLKLVTYIKSKNLRLNYSESVATRNLLN